eukprot:1229640-Prymnesium_polylepis.1
MRSSFSMPGTIFIPAAVSMTRRFCTHMLAPRALLAAGCAAAVDAGISCPADAEEQRALTAGPRCERQLVSRVPARQWRTMEEPTL